MCISGELERCLTDRLKNKQIEFINNFQWDGEKNYLLFSAEFVLKWREIFFLNKTWKYNYLQYLLMKKNTKNIFYLFICCIYRNSLNLNFQIRFINKKIIRFSTDLYSYFIYFSAIGVNKFTGCVLICRGHSRVNENVTRWSL